MATRKMMKRQINVYKTLHRNTLNRLSNMNRLIKRRISSFCSTRGTRQVTNGKLPVTESFTRRRRDLTTISKTYPLSSVTQKFHNGYTSHDGDLY